VSLSSRALKLMVQTILEKPFDREWSLQGFGMLRTYFTDKVRLHIWDSRYAVEDVTTIHDHPWSFASTVVAGEIVNVRYDEHGLRGEKFNRLKIMCGEGGGPAGEPEVARLWARDPEIYREGSTYHQAWDELHESRPKDGTVSIIERHFTDQSPDIARVFYPLNQEWVSAEPRPATRAEVGAICMDALETWFWSEDRIAKGNVVS
jgi:hypothetical protein